MEAPPISLGEKLRRARAERGFSLGNVASALHVPVRYIHALEMGDFSALPPAVYTRALIRQYGRYLGLNPGDLLDYSLPMRPQDRNPIRPAIPPLEKPPPISGTAIFTFLGMLAFAGLFMYLYTQYNSFAQSVDFGRPSGVESLPTPVGRSVSFFSTPLPTPTEAPAATPQPTPMPVAGLMIEARLLDKSWLQVWTDGRSILAETLGPGMRTFSAQQSIRMRVGNAGAVDVAVNGMHQGRLGSTGQVLDVSWVREQG